MSGLSALDLLREDHKKVKQLFQDFEQAEDDEAKSKIVAQATTELKIHTAIEEEYFYPAMRKQAKAADLIDEAEEEHLAAKEIIEEIEDMEDDDSGVGEKFRELAREVQHHIQEEEGEIFPKAEEKNLDLEKIGRQMSDRKIELKDEMGIVEDEEMTEKQPSKRHGSRT